MGYLIFVNEVSFPGDSDGKESACNAGEPCNARDPCSIPGSERSLGVGNANPLQYSCLENPMDRFHYVDKPDISLVYLLMNIHAVSSTKQYCNKSEYIISLRNSTLVAMG